MSAGGVFRRDSGPLSLADPPVYPALVGLSVAGAGGLLVLASMVFAPVLSAFGWRWPSVLAVLAWGLIGCGALLLVFALVWAWCRPPARRIESAMRRALCLHRHGNPLGLADGQLLPVIRCEVVRPGPPALYRLRVVGIASTVEDLARARSAISSALRGRFSSYSVVSVDTGLAHEYVDFFLEDVRQDRAIPVGQVSDMLSGDPTRLRVQVGVDLDLTSSGSILVAGKTRSGKTTGVLALLLQAASYGADAFGSRVLIVDPKQAELSRLPGVLTLDDDGQARGILDALRSFEDTIKIRQQALNDASVQHGDVRKWWDLGMHPSFVFIDEFVALRSLYPSGTAKEYAGYMVKDFEAVLRRIVTMGASAGCFVIVSIAQANADQLPTMLRDAFSTRVLFRPTPDEGRLMWDAVQVAGMPPRVYGPGEAWFTSSDGVHDSIYPVRFPRWSEGFRAYGELAQLLNNYDAVPAASSECDSLGSSARSALEPPAKPAVEPSSGASAEGAENRVAGLVLPPGTDPTRCQKHKRVPRVLGKEGTP